MYIYGLFDTRDQDHIRYIGKTDKSSTERPESHRKVARWASSKVSNKLRNNHTMNWMHKVLVEGGDISWRVIENAQTHDELCDLEEWYIKSYKESGHELTNSTVGGDGVVGYRHNLITRKKIDTSSLCRQSSIENSSR
jgi:hypothetical protein